MMPSRKSGKRSRKTAEAFDDAGQPGIDVVATPSAASLARAREGVIAYRYIIERTGPKRFVGMTVELPGAIATGKTPEECYARTVRSQEMLAAHMLEEGVPLPAPSAEAKREAQINIRVTEFEKLQLESAAQRQGFRSVSDFLRAAGLGMSRAG
jgi:predicted RNase H-like HicB family nuclease